MSIFKDNYNVYGTSPHWNSSPWTNFFYKPVSRYIDETSGDDVQLKMWCCQPEWIGTEIFIQAAPDTGTGGDILTRISYPGESLVNIEGDDYRFGVQASGKDTSELAHDDRTLKHWFLPGIALQLPDGTHATSTITQTTKWSYTPTDADLGEKVFDGGLHCWVKFPYDTVADGSSDAEKYVYTKPVSTSDIQLGEFLFIWNSAGHQVRRESNALGVNNAFTVEMQYSSINNPSDSDWVTEEALILNDVDIEDNTGNGSSTGVNDKFMMRNLLIGAKGTRQVRFKMYNPNGSFTECRMLRSQFIRISLYPTITM